MFYFVEKKNLYSPVYYVNWCLFILVIIIFFLTENIGSSVNSTLSSSASESLAKRAEVTIQDPVFQKIKVQFTADFDFSVPGAMKLQNFISRMKKWIKILEAETKLMSK